MNRVDRLFAILLRLQASRRQRAEDLAAAFEVTRRTIYRDIRALSESGIPIVSLPGEGYELVEGFYLPPLVFTEDEAVALSLGARFLVAQASGALPAAAEQGLAKISVVLSPEIRRRVTTLTDIISFFAPAQALDLDSPQLAMIQRAIHLRRVLHLRYHGFGRGEVTEREVEPHRLHYADGVWYVEGFCRLRQATRSFRLSRVLHMELKPETFKVLRRASTAETPFDVRIRFAGRAVPWVRERQHYAFAGEEAIDPSGDVVMTYRISRPTEMLAWILSWGAAAEVISPADLRERIRSEAAELAARLT